MVAREPGNISYCRVAGQCQGAYLWPRKAGGGVGYSKDFRRANAYGASGPDFLRNSASC